jgi:hypothetical protein
VSFNPDIEIASYDPKIPLAKPHLMMKKPAAGNLVKTKNSKAQLSVVSEPKHSAIL